MIQLLLIIFISLILFFILLLAFAIFIREKLGERWERQMENERLKYSLLINEVFPDVMAEKDRLVHKPLTPAWLAVEEELLRRMEVAAPGMTDEVYRCFEELNYVNYYLGILQKSNLWNRIDAAQKLGLLRCKRAEPYIIKALNDKSKEMRNVAITSLGLIGAEDSIAHLVEYLKLTVQHKEEASFRLVKSALIGGFGEASLPYLIGEAKNPSWQIRSHVIDTIAEIGDVRFSSILLEALNDPEPEVRAKAAKGVGKTRDSTASRRLIELSDDRDWVVRLHSLRALGEIGSVEGIDAVKNRLSDPNWHIRQEASRALLRIGDAAVPSLTTMVRQDQDRFAREQVLEELQRSGLIFMLFDEFTSKDDSTRKNIRDLLETVCTHGVTAPFLKGQKHADPVVRSMVVDILQKTGTEKANKTLTQILKDGGSRI